MGTLVATSSIPRLIISPFAGVIVDRTNRKWMLVSMDLIRGALVGFIGIAALAGFIQIWMVFAVGIIGGICGAFFGPAVGSSMPDIVPKSKIVQANSAMGVVYTTAGIIGSSAGGFLFQVIGAAFMFLADGVSYLFSALTECFIKIPKIERDRQDFNFWTDLKSGMRFVWDNPGMRTLFLLASVLNFFANMGIFLILPMFQSIEHLGAGRYGVTMATLALGALIGLLLTSFVAIPPRLRYRIFIWCGIIMTVAFAALPTYTTLWFMCPLAFIAGFTNAILNAFIGAIVQLTTPQDMRGKVFSFISTLAGGLTPFAIALAGVLAEYFPIRGLISVSFLISLGLILTIPLFFSSSFRQFINFDPEVCAKAL